MYLLEFPRVRKIIDDFIDKHPMIEFGPGHVLFGDYNVNNGCVYFVLNLIDKKLRIPEKERVELTHYLTDDHLYTIRGFIKEFLLIEEIVREVSLEIDTQLVYRETEEFVEKFIAKLMKTDVDDWTKEIDFSCLPDFDLEYFDFVYNYGWIESDNHAPK